jgi:hypothetical protein
MALFQLALKIITKATYAAFIIAVAIWRWRQPAAIESVSMTSIINENGEIINGVSQRRKCQKMAKKKYRAVMKKTRK